MNFQKLHFLWQDVWETVTKGIEKIGEKFMQLGAYINISYLHYLNMITSMANNMKKQLRTFKFLPRSKTRLHIMLQILMVEKRF